MSEGVLPFGRVVLRADGLLRSPPEPYSAIIWAVDGNGRWYKNMHGTALNPIWTPHAPPAEGDTE